jgi:ribonuclease HII
MLAPTLSTVYRIGADENGLGARLGPLIVTAVLARTDERGRRALRRKLPKRIREDLDDSKRLISHSDYTLGEAWARALVSGEPATPRDLVDQLTLEPLDELKRPCPEHVERQCWSTEQESFLASGKMVARVRRHLCELGERGIEVLAVRSSVVCTKRLNQARAQGKNRFVSDLHAMERLVLALRNVVGADVVAVCGKVGGIGQYSKFFGPLGGWLHAIMAEGQALSSYRFPTLGELHFVRDADASDPLVSLASLVGKYLRELLMGRVARYYLPSPDEDTEWPSGYHDPVTSRFVASTKLVRRRRNVPDECFERARDPEEPLEPRAVVASEASSP